MKSLFGEQGRPAGRERAEAATVAALVRRMFDAAGAGVAVTMDGRVWKGVSAPDDATARRLEAALAASFEKAGPSDIGSYPTPDAPAGATVTTVAFRPGALEEDVARVTIAVLGATGVAAGLDAAFSDIARVALQIVDNDLDATAVRRMGAALSRVEKMSKTGQWHFDLKTRVSSWSDEVFRIHDLPPGQAPTLDAALAFFPEDTRASIRKHFDEAGATGAGFTFTSPIETAPMIGAQITRQVVENMAIYKTAFADAVPFSMNISRSQIRNHEFLTLLSQLLNTELVSYRDFIIEMSEDAVTDRDQGHIGERLRELADRGLSFAFDDFGAGFSSLIQIDSYSVRQVKIDRQLIQDIHFDPHKLAIVDGILRICSSLNIDVIAECVELEEQATALRKLGIRHAQGNYFGRPMAFDAFLALNESVARSH